MDKLALERELLQIEGQRYNLNEQRKYAKQEKERAMVKLTHRRQEVDIVYSDVNLLRQRKQQLQT